MNGMITFATWNLQDYDAPREATHAVIRDMDPDVLAVQELIADGDDAAGQASARLHELAAATGLCCQGPDGPYPPRRIDRVHATRGVVDALRSHEVVDREQARAASDHLPVVITYEPAALSR